MKKIPALQLYWERLTEADIALLNVAVQSAYKRDNPGALPFLEMPKAIHAIKYLLANAPIERKGPWYRLMHKLESHIYADNSLPLINIARDTLMTKLDPVRLRRLIPVARRQKINALTWRAHMPFVKGEDGWFTVEKTPSTTVKDLYYITVNERYAAALMAWLSGVGHIQAYPPKKPHRRRR